MCNSRAILSVCHIPSSCGFALASSFCVPIRTNIHKPVLIHTHSLSTSERCNSFKKYSHTMLLMALLFAFYFTSLFQKFRESYLANNIFYEQYFFFFCHILDVLTYTSSSINCWSAFPPFFLGYAASSTSLVESFFRSPISFSFFQNSFKGSR